MTRLRHGFPIAPGGWPIVGHLPAIYRALPDFVREARARHGQVFWLRLMRDWVLFCTGEGAAELLKSKSFSSRHLPAVSPVVAGESLLSHDGPKHRHMRSAMSKPLSPRGLSVARVGAFSKRSLEELVAGWAARRRARVLPDVQEATLAIIFGMLGADPGDLPAWRRRYRDLLLANLGMKGTFPGTPGWRAARAKAWIDERFAVLVERARSGGGDEGLLRALALAEDDEGRRLDDRELVDNLRLMVLGGHETIASTLSWITVTLASRPDLWQALADESVGADVPATLDEARSFPLAEAIFREVIRLHPPFGAITRIAEEDVDFAGVRIPKDTQIGVDLWSASRDPGNFTAPETFRPARWLERGGHPTQLENVQFGMGPHFCIGYHLAWLEAVQFSVALSRAIHRRGLRPRLVGPEPSPIYLPTEHPPARTEIVFEPAN
jgi:cytochrome P450 family 117 subfamily A